MSNDKVLRIVSDSEATQSLRFYVGDRELSVISFKLGRKDDNGEVRRDDIVTATIEVPVRFGK